MKLDFRQLYLDRTGRLDRGTFWIAALILVAIFSIVQYISGFLNVSIISLLPSRSGQMTAYIINMLVPLFFVYPAYCLLLKRSNDRDRNQAIVQAIVTIIVAMYLFPKIVFLTSSPETVMAILQPIGRMFWLIYLVMAAMGAYMLADLGLKSGTKGSNRYGPEPLV